MKEMYQLTATEVMNHFDSSAQGKIIFLFITINY